jgi:hypothetical protein
MGHGPHVPGVRDGAGRGGSRPVRAAAVCRHPCSRAIRKGGGVGRGVCLTIPPGAIHGSRPFCGGRTRGCPAHLARGLRLPRIACTTDAPRTDCTGPHGRTADAGARPGRTVSGRTTNGDPSRLCLRQRQGSSRPASSPIRNTLSVCDRSQRAKKTEPDVRLCSEGRASRPGRNGRGQPDAGQRDSGDRGVRRCGRAEKQPSLAGMGDERGSNLPGDGRHTLPEVERRILPGRSGFIAERMRYC